MKVSIFGLGYVGCVSAACLARQGHTVVGVDVNEFKVKLLAEGKSPIVEDQLEDILKEVTGTKTKGPGSLRTTTSAAEAIRDTEISLLCVPTPSNDNGSLNLDFVRRCAHEIGECLKHKSAYHVVVVRSTMLPGSVESVVIPELEAASGKAMGTDFGVAINPEFLRESTSVQDFYNPSVTVIGANDEHSGKTVAKLYPFLDAPLVHTDLRTAEMVKYSCNAFHALKVTFANEIGAICKGSGIDSHKVMEIFCMDRKLNLSPYYLKPGFAFGGSCLPKDLRALTYLARQNDVETQILNAILPSNDTHLDRAIQWILRSGKRKIGLLGLSFKPGTDDLRESPMVRLAEALIGKGYELNIYDKNVSLSQLIGANKAYIEQQIPHISKLMSGDLQQVIDDAEVLVVGNNDPDFHELMSSGCKTPIFDLARLPNEEATYPENYEGLCW